jgi:hypothetical protein
MSDTQHRPIVGPVLAHGVIARIVEFGDGSGAVEAWDTKQRQWLSGENAVVDAGDAFSAPVATIWDLIDAGERKADWADAQA